MVYDNSYINVRSWDGSTGILLVELVKGGLKRF